MVQIPPAAERLTVRIQPLTEAQVSGSNLTGAREFAGQPLTEAQVSGSNPTGGREFDGPTSNPSLRHRSVVQIPPAAESLTVRHPTFN